LNRPAIAFVSPSSTVSLSHFLVPIHSLFHIQTQSKPTCLTNEEVLAEDAEEIADAEIADAVADAEEAGAGAAGIVKKTSGRP